eukprot:scaffold17244_cov55-Attheya_sp.AAC.5
MSKSARKEANLVPQLIVLLFLAAMSTRLVACAFVRSAFVVPTARRSGCAAQWMGFHSTMRHMASEDGEEFRKSYGIRGVGRNSSVQLETSTGHVIQSDVPASMGGTDTAPQPVELLLGSLLGCTQATALYVGRMVKPRILIDHLEFDLQAHRDQRGALSQPITTLPTIPARLQQVSGTITIHLKDSRQILSPDQLQFLETQTEARCPIANMMLASGCQFNITWKQVPS